MKNLISYPKQTLSTLFLFFAFLMIIEAQDYSQVVRENGLIMQRVDEEHVGKINYVYSAEHSRNFMYMRATKDDNRNNCILTQDGLLRISEFDLCRTPESNDEIIVDLENTDIKLYVNGDASKSVGGSMWNTVSDQRLKKNISSLKNSLETLKEVEFVEFQYNGLARTPADEKYYGVLAQQVREVLPSTVKTFSGRLHISHKNDTELLMFNPNDLMYTGLNAIKELANITEEQHQELVENLEEEKRKNEFLEDRVDELENKLEQLISSLSQGELRKTSYSSSVILSGQETGKLHQNIPNPLNQSTLIKYELPQITNEASILVQDMSGRVIQKIMLPDNVKNGTVEFNASKVGLDNGTYVYTLVVSGEYIDSKKMIFFE